MRLVIGVRRRVWLSTVVPGLLSLTAHLSTAQSQGHRGEVRLLADLQALVRQNISVGAVLAEGEAFDAAVLLVPEDTKEGAVVERALVVSGFIKRWNGPFSVSESRSSVNLVSMKAARCRAGLNRKLARRVYNGSPYEILFLVAASFDSALRSQRPPGLLSSGPGSEGASAERLTAPVEVSVSEGDSLQDVLNTLAERSGLGWFARENCGSRVGGCTCQLGLITPSSLTWTGYDAAVGLPLSNQ